jgi:hypothetical protein
LGKPRSNRARAQGLFFCWFEGAPSPKDPAKLTHRDIPATAPKTDRGTVGEDSIDGRRDEQAGIARRFVRLL